MFIKRFKHYSVKLDLEPLSNPKDRVSIGLKQVLMFTGKCFNYYRQQLGYILGAFICLSVCLCSQLLQN